MKKTKTTYTNPTAEADKIYLNKGYKSMKEVLEANDIETLMEWVKEGEDLMRAYHEAQPKMSIVSEDDFFGDI